MVSSACRVVLGDAGSVYPPVLDRLEVGEVQTLDHDLSVDADCQGDGITISTSAWAWHADDVNGSEPTIGADTVTGLITRVYLTAVATGTWRLVNTVALSDNRTLIRTSVVVVAQSVKAF